MSDMLDANVREVQLFSGLDVDACVISLSLF